MHKFGRVDRALDRVSAKLNDILAATVNGADRFERAFRRLDSLRYGERPSDRELRIACAVISNRIR